MFLKIFVQFLHPFFKFLFIKLPFKLVEFMFAKFFFQFFHIFLELLIIKVMEFKMFLMLWKFFSELFHFLLKFIYVKMEIVKPESEFSFPGPHLIELIINFILIILNKIIGYFISVFVIRSYFIPL